MKYLNKNSKPKRTLELSMILEIKYLNTLRIKLGELNKKESELLKSNSVS